MRHEANNLCADQCVIQKHNTQFSKNFNRFRRIHIYIFQSRDPHQCGQARPSSNSSYRRTSTNDRWAGTMQHRLGWETRACVLYARITMWKVRPWALSARWTLHTRCAAPAGIACSHRRKHARSSASIRVRAPSYNGHGWHSKCRTNTQYINSRWWWLLALLCVCVVHMCLKTWHDRWTNYNTWPDPFRQQSTCEHTKSGVKTQSR